MIDESQVAIGSERSTKQDHANETDRSMKETREVIAHDTIHTSAAKEQSTKIPIALHVVWLFLGRDTVDRSFQLLVLMFCHCDRLYWRAIAVNWADILYCSARTFRYLLFYDETTPNYHHIHREIQRRASGPTHTSLSRAIDVCHCLHVCLLAYSVFFCASRPISECYLCLSCWMCNYSLKIVRLCQS